MKRKLLIIVIFLMMCSTAFSKPQKLKLELIRSPNKIFDCPQLNPNFEFASMFYQAVCFNRNLLNLVDNEILKAIKRSYNDEYEIDDDALSQIARVSNGDLRYAYNILEISIINSKENHITYDDVYKYATVANNSSFKGDLCTRQSKVSTGRMLA